MLFTESIMVEVRRAHIEHDVPFYEILAFIMLATNADPKHLSVAKGKIFHDSVADINPVHRCLANLHVGITGIRYSIARSVGYQDHPFDLMKPSYNIKAFALYFSQISRDAPPRDKIAHLTDAIPLYNVSEEMLRDQVRQAIQMPLI